MSTLFDEIQQLDIAERIQLVEDLWDSVAARSSNFPITAMLGGHVFCAHAED